MPANNPPTNCTSTFVAFLSASDPVLTTYILLWGSIREPFTKKMLGDNDYLLSFTKGFSELPSPAQVPLVGAGFVYIMAFVVTSTTGLCKTYGGVCCHGT